MRRGPYDQRSERRRPYSNPNRRPQATAAPRASSNPQPAAPSDTVQISSAAAQGLKEAIENPAQTAQEAANGDQVAKRLLAREAADKLV